MHLEQKIEKQKTIKNEKEAPRPFERIFHNAPAKLLDFFILSKEYDYTEAEIARRTGLTPKTVSRELEILVNENIVKLTRKIGRSNMYTLDEAENVKGLIQYMDNTIKIAYESLSKA